MKRRPKIKTTFIIWEKGNNNNVPTFIIWEKGNNNNVPRDAEVRRWIYHNGKRGTQYHVDEISETEEEREKLWIQKQEEGYKFIMGEKHKVENEEDEKKWEKLILYYRTYCIRTYKDDPRNWQTVDNASSNSDTRKLHHIIQDSVKGYLWVTAADNLYAYKITARSEERRVGKECRL